MIGMTPNRWLPMRSILCGLFLGVAVVAAFCVLAGEWVLTAGFGAVELAILGLAIRNYMHGR